MACDLVARGRCAAMAAVVALAALGAAPAGAQDKPLKEGEVTEQRLIDALAAPPAASGVAAAYSRGFRPVTVAEPRRQSILITFATDSAELTPRARNALDVVARALTSDKLAALRVQVEGHADPRGGDEHNAALSQARAQSVVDYLVSKHGIARERLTPIGRGSTQLLNRADPLAPENRRVTLVTMQ